MPTTPKGDTLKSSSSKKRKSVASGSDRPTKQSKKISSYFPPLHPVSSNPREGENGSMPLNDEQRRVMDMVVEEGKSVFFTGAAGMSFIPLRFLLLIWCFWSARYRKIAPSPSYYRLSQE